MSTAITLLALLSVVRGAAVVPSDPGLAPAALATFHGRVVQAEDGAPIARARVELCTNRRIVLSRSYRDPRSGIAPTEPSAWTDDDGRFQVACDPTREAWILVEAETRSPGASAQLAGHEDVAHELELALPRAARLEIELDLGANHVDHRYFGALVEVRVTSPLDASSFPSWLRVADGELRRTYASRSADVEPFVLDGLAAGSPLAIELLRDGVFLGRIEPDVVLSAGETRRIAWKLREGRAKSGGALRAVVHDTEGRPLPGELVLLEPERGSRALLDPEHAANQRTESDGSFRWANLRPGRYLLDLGGDRCATPVEVEVDGANEAVATLISRPTRTLHGRTIDAAGAPVPGARVTFAAWADLGLYDVFGRSDEAGAFELRVPAGEAGVLRAVHPASDAIVVDTVECDMELLPDGTRRELDPAAPQVIRFPPIASLRVLVVDAAGRPTPARITSDPRAPLGAIAGGPARSEAIVLGAATMVRAVTEDGRIAFADLGASTPEVVTLRLAPAAPIRLRHRDRSSANVDPGADAERLLVVRIETKEGLTLGTTTLIRGVDAVVLVPVGDWVVRATGRRDVALRAEAGVETLVDL